MTPFSKCPRCGLFEDKRTSCVCGYGATDSLRPSEPKTPSPVVSESPLLIDTSELMQRFILRNILVFAVAFAIAVGVVNTLTSPQGVSWSSTAIHAGIGLLSGGVIGLVIAVIAIANGRFDPLKSVTADHPSTDPAQSPPHERRPLLTLVFILPVAGYLGGTLLSQAGTTATMLVSVGVFVLLGVLTAHAFPIKDPYSNSWLFASLAALLVFPFFVAVALVMGTAMFWWVVPLVQGHRRFDQTEVLAVLQTCYHLLGTLVGVVFVVIAFFPGQSKKRNQADTSKPTSRAS